MKQLDAKALAAAASMKKADDFVQSRIPSDQAALVSYLFVKQLKSDSSRFNKLMTGLRKGNTFDKSFRQSYGKTPDQLINNK